MAHILNMSGFDMSMHPVSLYFKKLLTSKEKGRNRESHFGTDVSRPFEPWAEILNCTNNRTAGGGGRRREVGFRQRRIAPSWQLPHIIFVSSVVVASLSTMGFSAGHAAGIRLLA